jgi:hypothetical protein
MQIRMRYLDDAPLEERRARAVQMRRMLPESVLEEVGGLDPAAIAQVREEAWPDVRDADELHDVLHTLVALPESGLNSAYRPVEILFRAIDWTARGRAASANLVGEGRAADALTGSRPSAPGLFQPCFPRHDLRRGWPMLKRRLLLATMPC